MDGIQVKQFVKSLIGRFRKPSQQGATRSSDFLAGEESRFEPNIAEADVAECPFRATLLPGPPRNLVVKGWRFLPHSYAMVNQWQLLALLRRADIRLQHLDAPHYKANWCRTANLFATTAERQLAEIPAPPPDKQSDALLRLYFPYDFSPSTARRTAVFGTSEVQCILKAQCGDEGMYENFRRGLAPPDVTVVTPSRWSAEGFYQAGFKPEQVLVIPHGADVATFRPMPGLREAARRAVPVAEDEFVFLNVGAMTGSKGIDLLMQAFAQVVRHFPKARLVLKGMDPLYNSRGRLQKILKTVDVADQTRVATRIAYFGESFSNRKMALLYQAADAYVSPYRSEGFNLPVLEAVASGLPIICTAGGSTDDFVSDAFARRIKARKESRMVGEDRWTELEPDLAALVQLMMSVIQDHAWRQAASVAGPAHVQANFTWDLVTERLVHGLFGRPAL